MKAVLRISILLNVLCAGYILVKGSELLTIDYLGKAESVKEQIEELDQEFMEVETAITDEQITCDTVYTVSEYDLSTGREDQHQESLPTSYIGMTRNQLIEWIDDYNQSATLEDLELGFQSMELVSFSKEEIKVRKRIESEPQASDTEKAKARESEVGELIDLEENTGLEEVTDVYYGCILAQDGLLTVYDGNRRHVIQYTDIALFDLPLEVQQEIMDGKYVRSEEELYNLLESYSS